MGASGESRPLLAMSLDFLKSALALPREREKLTRLETQLTKLINSPDRAAAGLHLNPGLPTDVSTRGDDPTGSPAAQAQQAA